VFRRADGNSIRAFGDALDQSAEHFAGAEFVKRLDPGLGHEHNRLAPAHGAGYLLDQTTHDFRGIGNGFGQNIGDDGNSGDVHRHFIECLGHDFGGRLHERTMERGGNRQQYRPPRAFRLGHFHGALHGGLVAGYDDLTAAMAPVPTGTACCIARPRVRRSRAASLSEKAPAAASAEYSPSEWPATNRASFFRSRSASASSTRTTAS